MRRMRSTSLLGQSRLDLGCAASLARLRRADQQWLRLDPAAGRSALADLDIAVPPREPAADDLVVLPGGAIALFGTAPGALVCDPQEAVATTQPDRWRTALGADALTLLHGPAGLAVHAGPPPPRPPAQCLTIAADLPGAPAGRVLIQWLRHGAVLWPLVQAPPLLVLAATLTGQPLEPGAPPLPAADWQAADADLRYDRVAPALAEHVSDLLAAEVSDALRFALVAHCVDGRASLASRIAEALAVLPAHVLPRPAAWPGAPTAGWGSAAARLLTSRSPLVLLGLERADPPRRTVTALRAAAQRQRRAALFLETDDPADREIIPIDSDAALFLARRAAATVRLGLVCAPPEDPIALYALAHHLAEAADVPVLAAAPCWGFRHRIDPDGGEAGNAAWFGLGAGLDELDGLVP
jgi:hypothetical protein